ncbi:hypothetical protein TNCV_746141 [Trichonephila clavipes]|nr:hypothetical protein TNCV_746141 [Trichonephila clavipes]
MNYETFATNDGKCWESITRGMVYLHLIVDIDNNHPKRLPETISFYNSTKFGIAVADQMARKCSVKAGSRRRPVHVFYNINDLAGMHGFYTKKLLEQNNEEIISSTTHPRVA